MEGSLNPRARGAARRATQEGGPYIAVITGSGAGNVGDSTSCGRYDHCQPEREADSLPYIHFANLPGITQGEAVTNGNAVCAPTTYAAMIARFRAGLERSAWASVRW